MACPYYYANDTYYTWNADQNGYEVVDAARRRAGCESPATTQPPPSDDCTSTRRTVSRDDQQSNDKYECHKWANSQTGSTRRSPPAAYRRIRRRDKRADYQRAMRACLEGRGYSVR